jgi:hypothetical protein
LVLKASFSSGVISNLTPGWVASNWRAILAHSDIIGSAFAMCHQLIVFPEPDSPPSPLHPARTVPAAAAVRPSSDRRLIRIGSVTVNSPFGAVAGT